MKRRTAYLGIAAAIGSAAFLIHARMTGAAAPKTTAPSTTASAAVISAAGKVEPVSEEVKIGSQVSGVLREVPVTEGQHLRRGQLIAVLDNADYAARVSEAEATVAVRQAALDRVLNGARREERGEAAAAIDEAKAVLADARATLARRQSLYSTGDISRADLDTAEREFHVAEARLNEATQHHAFVDAPARDDERARAEADLALARAQLGEFRALLDKTLVRAPFDGTVLKRFRRAGETVSDKGDTPIVSFGDDSRLRVRVDVDETDVARLHLGSRAYFTAQAFGDTRFWGRVVQIGRQLGRKNVDTDQPTEKLDTKVLETLVELEGHPPLPSGLRVDSFLLVGEGQ